MNFTRVLFFLSTSAFAHTADVGFGASADAGVDFDPPQLKTSVEAEYPPDALRQRLTGSVGMELLVNEQGKVVDLRVTQSAGRSLAW